VIFFGQRAQEVIKPFLALPDGTSRPVAKPLFSPAEAMQEMRDKRTAERKKNGTPLNQGNGVGTNRKRNPSKVPGEAYTRHSYHAAITRGCKKAGITPWFPYQIRHAVAEATRERFGIEAASALLGHADVKITQHYAKLQSQKALAVAECVG